MLYALLSERSIRSHYQNNPHGNRRQCCSVCGKIEPVDTLFGQCTGCDLKVYCSSRCQKSDWPMHKVVCSGLESAQLDEMQDFRRRIHKFKTIFLPLIISLVEVKLALCSKEAHTKGDDEIFKSHFVLIHLNSLLESAKKPRLAIGKIEVLNMAEFERSFYDKSCSQWKGETLTSYGLQMSTSEGQPCRSFNTHHTKENPITNFQDENKESLQKSLLAIVQTINAVAKGLAPDFYAIIKESIEKKK